MSIRSPIRYAGGKFYQTKFIHSNLPSRPLFIDLFCGNCSVALASSSEKIICNDINKELINFWLSLRDHCDLLVSNLSESPYCRETFEGAALWEFDGVDPENLNPYSMVSMATNYFVRNRMSRDGLMKEYTESPRLRRGLPEMTSSYLTAISELPRLSQRIQGWEFWSRDFTEILKEYKKDENASIFCDPPYRHNKNSKRSTKKLYKHEFTDEQHSALLDLVQGAAATISIIHYEDEEYLTKLKNWELYKKEMSLNMGVNKAKSRKMEHLWVNK